MRIISGIARGFKLKVPNDEKIRPTTEKVKEAVFDSLQFCLKGKVFLDLFAGSGQMGIEALSRGASHVFFVDYFRESLRTINFNLSRLKGIFGHKFSVVNKDVILFLKANEEVFDVVYLDPPYSSGIIHDVLVQMSSFVSLEGIVICEHSKRDILPKRVETLEVFKIKNYGSISVTYYRKECVSCTLS